MVRWAQINCLWANFIMKMDDDIILNIEKLLVSLHTFKSGITGHRVHSFRTLKEGQPGYIPSKYYPINGTRYPPYVYGGVYIISTVVLDKLIDGIDNYTGYYLENEDFFLSGVIAIKRACSIIRLSRYQIYV